MENKRIAEITPAYSDKLILQLKKQAEQYGDFKFDDDNWYFKKRHKNAASKTNFSLRFHMISEDKKDLVKYYALMSTLSLPSIQIRIGYLRKFFEYIESHAPNMKLHEIDRKFINQYEHFLRYNSRSMEVAKMNYAAILGFFDKMEEFPDTPSVNPCKRINPFKTKRTKKDEKYIPKEITRQYDRMMKNEELPIPLEVRTLYWLIRSFPNRITEVLSLKTNCLKTLYSFYVLNVPTYKQNGGYDIEEIKTLPIVDSGHGKYIIDLIERMKERNRELQENNLVEQQQENYLFLTDDWTLKSKDGELIIHQRSNKNKTKILSSHMFTNSLETLANHFQIKDKEGNLYVPTTHQFRHNATTDRLYLAGYTVEQASKLSGHKNMNMMTNSYTHQLKEKHKEVLLKASELKGSSDAPVEFKGRIMNLDEKTVNLLSKNPRTYLTWEANNQKGVGLCSDISGCNPKGTSVHFECYSCDWFVPKAEYLLDYQKEKEYWEQIIQDSEGNPKRAAHLENAIRNVTLLERIIDICNKGIDSYKKQIADKQRKVDTNDL